MPFLRVIATMGRSFKYLCIGLLAIFFNSCGSNDALFKVETFMDFTIQPGLNVIEAHYFVGQNIPITLSTQLDNLNIEEEDIMQVVAGNATLYPRFSNSLNMEFIESVNVYLRKDFNDLDNDKEIFYREHLPLGNNTEIRLFNSISDVTELLLENTAIVVVRLEFRQFPPANIDMRLDMSFSVYVEE